MAIFMTVWLHPFSTKYVICGNGVPRAGEILRFVQNPITKYMVPTILILRATTSGASVNLVIVDYSGSFNHLHIMAKIEVMF